ncbi:Fe2+-dependent dioxygenase [Glacieibacterium frigidum]|uniref:Fe2+-dependent dioxygenase n=1 Tax=Glacieibacterium frigidum TaxID=2593303 RepID=A0A552U7Y7_9SPHN|nr:Fe2+-dependent dioxygenase [Glacieibacterium frigidum]TRW14334.1 Fe2+-dependent dioxygenase [Glacieibacterium frigidum]
MLIVVPAVLPPHEAVACAAALQAADWVDGKTTAGLQSAPVKDNAQLPEASPVAREWGARILDALGAAPTFVSAALPHRTFPPLFNRYAGGQSFGTHIDNAIRPVRGTPVKLRTDLSATLFLSDPDSYDGGELVVETVYGAQSVKLAAGDLVLYPASSLHRVEPVTRGCRLASFFWVQSMVRDDAARAMLFDLDGTIQALAAERGIGSAHVVQLTGLYHNLVRRWADT